MAGLLSRDRRRELPPSLFANCANHRHFDVGRISWSSYDIKRPFVDGIKVQFPVAASRQYDNARGFVVRAIEMKQVRVPAVGQPLVAKNNFKSMLRKDFFGLRPARTRDDIGGKGLEDTDERLPVLQL